MRCPVCILAESEPGSLAALSAALDAAGVAFEFRPPESLSARDDPAVPFVVDPRALATGRIPASLGSAPTAPPILLAAPEHERRTVSAGLAHGFADLLDPCAEPFELRRRLAVAARFGLRRRILRIQRRSLDAYAALERLPDGGPAPTPAATAAERPHVLVAGPGTPARIGLLQILTGWTRTTLAHSFDLATDTTDLDLVVVTGPPRGTPVQLPPPSPAGGLFRPAAVLATQGAWADAADVLPAETSPELVRMRLRSWLGHRRAERDLRAAVDQWSHAAIVDPASRLLGRAFLLDMLDAVLAAPGGAGTSIVGLAFDGLANVDRWLGHAMGERVLRLVGRAIASMTRAEDIAGRVHAGRFVVALPAADDAAARTLATRLIARLETLRLPPEIDPCFRAATAEFRAGQDAARLVQTALDRLELAAARMGAA